MNEDYYQFLRNGITQVDQIPILSATHLIVFKAKAWLDLTQRQAVGEHVDSKNMKKHKNDVFRLSNLLSPGQKVVVPPSILRDLHAFIHAMRSEDVDLKALKILSDVKDDILDLLESIYVAEAQ